LSKLASVPNHYLVEEALPRPLLSGGETSRKMQIACIVCHESFLPTVKEILKTGIENDDKSSPLKLVLGPRRVVDLGDNASPDAVAGYRTVERLVRQGLDLSEAPKKLLRGDRLVYIFQSFGISDLIKAMVTTHRNGYHSGIPILVTATRNAQFARMEL